MMRLFLSLIRRLFGRPADSASCDQRKMAPVSRMINAPWVPMSYVRFHCGGCVLVVPVNLN